MLLSQNGEMETLHVLFTKISKQDYYIYAFISQKGIFGRYLSDNKKREKIIM